MTDKLGVSVEQLNCIGHLTYQLLNGLSRRDITEELPRESLKQLSVQKLDAMMEQVNIHKEH